MHQPLPRIGRAKMPVGSAAEEHRVAEGDRGIGGEPRRVRADRGEPIDRRKAAKRHLPAAWPGAPGAHRQHVAGPQPALWTASAQLQSVIDEDRVFQIFVGRVHAEVADAVVERDQHVAAAGAGAAHVGQPAGVEEQPAAVDFSLRVGMGAVALVEAVGRGDVLKEHVAGPAMDVEAVVGKPGHVQVADDDVGGGAGDVHAVVPHDAFDRERFKRLSLGQMVIDRSALDRALPRLQPLLDRDRRHPAAGDHEGHGLRNAHQSHHPRRTGRPPATCGDGLRFALGGHQLHITDRLCGGPHVEVLVRRKVDPVARLECQGGGGGRHPLVAHHQRGGLRKIIPPIHAAPPRLPTRGRTVLGPGERGAVPVDDERAARLSTGVVPVWMRGEQERFAVGIPADGEVNRVARLRNLHRPQDRPHRAAGCRLDRRGQAVVGIVADL